MIAALFSVMLSAANPGAASPQSQPAPATTDVADKEERKICKREGATESRLAAKRTCLTAAQWRERQDNATRGLGDVSK